MKNKIPKFPIGSEQIFENPAIVMSLTAGAMTVGYLYSLEIVLSFFPNIPQTIRDEIVTNLLCIPLLATLSTWLMIWFYDFAKMLILGVGKEKSDA